MFGRFYEDFELNEAIPHFPAKTIMESDNNLFCLLTRNTHPLHSNTEYAKNSQLSPHKRIMVVGTLVFSLAVGMSVPDISGKAIANLGYSNVVHHLPVFIGDTISAHSYCIAKRLSEKHPSRGIVTVKTIVVNQCYDHVLSFERDILIPTKEAYDTA